MGPACRLLSVCRIAARRGRVNWNIEVVIQRPADCIAACMGHVNWNPKTRRVLLMNGIAARMGRVNWNRHENVETTIIYASRPVGSRELKYGFTAVWMGAFKIAARVGRANWNYMMQIIKIVLMVAWIEMANISYRLPDDKNRGLYGCVNLYWLYILITDIKSRSTGCVVRNYTNRT